MQRPPSLRAASAPLQCVDSPTQRLEALKHKLPELADLLALSPRSEASTAAGSPAAGAAACSSPLMWLAGGSSAGSTPGGSPTKGWASEATSLTLYKVTCASPKSSASPLGVSKQRGRKLVSLQVCALLWGPVLRCQAPQVLP